MEFFLLKNGFVLYASNEELIEFALAVAEDRMSRAQSAEWLSFRAFRMSWSEERARRWLHSLPDEHARGVEAWIDSGRASDFLASIAERLLERTVQLKDEVAVYTA